MVEEESTANNKLQLAVAALAALVIRQARLSMIEGRLISGVDRYPGSPIGLNAEDRKAMALVSRLCLANGRPDYGAEIHQLLAWCCKPFKEWLPAQITTAGWGEIVLINKEDGSPTPEAEELARGFSSVTAGMEELLFQKLMDLLAKQPRTLGDSYYSLIREFVVRHPLATTEEIRALGEELSSPLWLCVQQFYEPVPDAWGKQGQVALCAHCGGAMKFKVGVASCRSTACSMSNPTKIDTYRPQESLLRVSRGIRQYWVEPGIDEIRLYDALRAQGVQAQLYPFRDRVDIAVNDIGIDLKSYSSPELLGARIRRDKGGLAHYARKWLVIPDWLAQVTPSYVNRVNDAMEEVAQSVRCLTAGEAYKEIIKNA